MKDPLITIGISTFNRVQSLREYCLPALEKLNYSSHEIIIIDDCSTDETYDFLHSYTTNRNEFRVFRNRKNQGLCYSRNRILEESKGDIILFSDDDVSLFPECLGELTSLYEKDPQIMFVWGCVYQCHGLNDKEKETFGTGSLFSIRKIVSEHLQFDTNIRYFKTFGCEEHDFARRLQKTKIKLVKAVMVKANHYQAPAKDRAWRGLGGDLNYIYEQVKKGSVVEHYQFLLAGLGYAGKKLLGLPSDENKVRVKCQKSVHALHNILALMRQGKLITAGKYLFFVMIDIPFRAVVRRKVEATHLNNFLDALSNEKILDK